MKKNRMLRLASALLILTLLTTSVIGGTFAKYVSTGSVSDTARVAKWGVEIKTSGTLYSDAYAKKDDTAGSTTSNLPTTWKEETTFTSISVAAANDANRDNIVAPGTKSYENGLTFGISGTPEVAVKVKADITAEDIFLGAGSYGVLVPATEVKDALSLQKLLDAHSYTPTGETNVKYDVFLKAADTYTRVTGTDDFNAANSGNYYILTDKVTLDADYFPVVYKLEGQTAGADTDKKAIDVALKLANAIKSTTADTTKPYSVSYTVESDTYAANTNLATAGPAFGNEILTWEWAFEADTTATEAVKKETDAKDTLLGDLMAKKADPTVVDYEIVAVGADDAVTVLTIGTDDDYTVKNGSTVVANLYTQFSIELTVEQID